MGKTTGSEETKKKEKAKGLTKKGGADNAVGKELKGKDDTVKEKLTEKDKKDVGGNRELENFLEGQILEMEVELECPVCLEVATTSPIYKCLDDHLLCRLQEKILLIHFSLCFNVKC